MDKEISRMRPKLICMTPVRNEAWCLDVFLKCASLWADYIIIADQDSTDGSREIASKYPKVILVKNNGNNYNEDERQKLLIKEARKIEGPRILVTLDADEVFTANFNETNDWQRILNSKPGEVFGFQWANITPDKTKYFLSSYYYPWVFHDDGITEHRKYVKWIHSMRIPYPQNADLEYYNVHDFKVFHFARINQKRVDSKNRFYQCLVNTIESDAHFISLFRTYHHKKEKIYTIPSEWVRNYEKNNLKIIEQLYLSESLFWYDMVVKEQFVKYGFSKFKYLDIWDKQWIVEMKKEIEINDPRNILIKTIHVYLRVTQKISGTILIRIMDKTLRKLFRS